MKKTTKTKKKKKNERISSSKGKKEEREKTNEKKEYIIPLLHRGNVTLIRLLLTVDSAGDAGITTMRLFRELRSTGYGQITLQRALDDGLIVRKQGESVHGQFPPVFNIITPRGRDMLVSQLMIK